MTAYFEGAEKFVFIDFETTGRDLLGRDYFNNDVSKNDATQVAIAWYDDAQLTSAHSYIQPLSDYFKLKHWSHASPQRENCIDAPKFNELHPILAGIIGGKTLVAHHSPFDKRVLDDSMIGIGKVPFQNEWIDTKEMSKRYLPNAGACFKSCDSRCGGHTLKHLHSYFGFGDFDHHNAIADVFALARIFSIMYKPKTDYNKDWLFT